MGELVPLVESYGVDVRMNKPTTIVKNVYTTSIGVNGGETLDSLGIKTGKVSLTKGTHDIYFDKSFLAPYYATATGTTISGASVTVIVYPEVNLNKFTIKIAADCLVRWSAKVLTQ